MSISKQFAHKVIGLLVICLLLTACAFKGKPLISSGTAFEPHLIWNGSHFGIVYYHSSSSGAWPQLNLIKVDKAGTVAAAKTGVGSIPHFYQPFYLSDLVWNGDNNQFAFAFTKGKVIHFVRLDSSLNVIGSPLVVKFNVLVSSSEHPTLTDLSLVWNKVKKEYGLSYITQEHPYLQNRHDDVYLSRISASGTFIGPYERIHLVSCPGDCAKTSLTYNTSNGVYALSYLKTNYPLYQVMIGIYPPGGTVVESALMLGWNPGPGAATRIIFDHRTNQYLVVALKGKTGLSGYEIGYQLAAANGSPVGSYYLRSGTQGYHEIVSVANYLDPVKNKYLICASEKPQIHCWLATATGYVGNDVAYTSKSVNSWAPSLNVVDANYLAWIQSGALYFGVAK